MKKIHLIAALLAMLLPITQALGSATFWAKVTLDKTTSSPTGSGLVYAYGQTNNNDFKDPPHTFSVSQEFSGSWSAPSSGNVVMNLSAKANYGYKFDGWYTDAAGTTKYDKTSVSKNSSAKNEGSAADGGTYYAKFISNPDSCTLTLNKPEGLASYTVTAPSGFTADLSHGGSATVYKGDQYTFKYNLSSDEYDFINWTVNGDQKTGNPVSVTISGDTTVVLTLKKKVTCTATCQGSVGGTYKANGTTVSASEYEVSNFGSVTVSLSDPVANSGYAFYGWYKLYSNGVKEYLSYYSSVSTGEMKENIIIGAEFREVQDCTVNFIAPAEGKITYAISGGNSGEVDDADKSETVPAGAAVTLTATCDYANRRAKWYTKDESGEKVYFSIDKNLTKKFASSVALGVDFIPVNEKIVNAIEAAQSSSSHEAILAADAEIVLDTSIEIPSGIKIDLDGHTLYVDGTLTVNGTLVNGTVSKCQKLLKQTGDGLSPCNPYGSIKYWKTAPATSSASITGSGWSGTTSTHVTIMRGDGVAIRKVYTETPAVLKCKADANIAANHITSITSAETGNSRTDDKLTAPPSYDGTDQKTQKASLMPISASGEIDMLVLVASGVSISGKMRDGDSQSRYYYQGVVDCAGYDCGGMSNNVHNEHRVTYLNGGTITVAGSVKFQNALVRFCNCKVVNTGKARNTPHYCFYDCELSSLSFSKHSDGGTADVRFFGGKYAYGFDGITDPVSKIYAGAFSPKPDKETWVDEDIKSKMTFVQHTDGYWYLEPNQDPNVARIGSTPYLTLELALDYLNENDSATITLLRDVQMESAYTLEAGKSLVIELGGCHIDAPNGFIKNYGSLSIRDNNNSLAVCGVTVGNGSNIIENYDNGTVDICYGLYNGNFTVNGGTFTTHHGKFIGSVANNGGTLNLKGGVFSSDVSSLMNEGYHAFAYDGWYYVGRFPKPEDDSSSIASFARVLTAMPSADKTLYLAKKTYSLTSCSSVDEWKQVAELKAAYALYDDEFNFDILAGFDRDIAANTVQATIDTKLGPRSDYFPAMSAGVLERIFSPRITQTPISYKRFIYDNGEGNYDTMEAGISDVNNANAGTACVLAMDLWKYHDKTKTTKDSYLTILALPYVFGAGNNVAMIRPANGTATFYSTLDAAMDAVANGGTVMLANDNTAPLKLEKAGTYTFDRMGFRHSGGVELGEGLSIKSETTAVSSVATLIPTAVATTYVIVDESEANVVESGGVMYPTIEAAIEAAEGNTVAVTVVAADTETIDLDAGKTLVVTVADGVTANVTVDPGEGAFIDATTDGNTTTYESKKITVEMEEPPAQATVEVVKVDHGVTNAVSDATLVNEAVYALTGNHDVSRTDNTDKLDVLDKITVMPTKIVEDVTSGTMIIRSVTFDVVPHLKAGQSLAEGQKLKFRLPVDATATQLSAIVYHGTAQFGVYPVQTYNNEKYVEVESADFSPYGYDLLDGETANPVAAIGTTGYATFAEAIEAAEEYKTANGSYPVITVLDATAEQTNPDWKIADGKLVHKVYVAQVGETKYESLAAAVAATSAGDTITMLADDNVSLTNGQELEINKSLTITGPVDGDGKPLYTIYGTEDATGANRILIDGSGTVTLSNLNIAGFGNNHATDASHAAVYVASTFTGTVNLSNLNISDFNRGGVFLYGGTFNVTDCTIDCANDRTGAFTKGIEIRNNASGTIADSTIVNMTSESDESVAGGIEFYGNGDVTVSGCTIEGDSMGAIGIGTAGFTDTTTTGTITVEGCKITVWNAALYATVLGDGLGENGTTIKVTGGDYTADNFAISALYGAVEIEDGTFNGMLEVGDEDLGESGSLSISGGLFEDDVLEAYCADGYIPTVDEDTGLNTVKQGSYVAAIYDDNDDLVGKYETLADAFADASEGDTVLLLTDVTEALAYGENISATLNLNGKTISVSSGSAISVTAGELTITSVVDDDGYATGGIVGAISVSDGASLKLTGGIYDVDWDDCDIEGSIAVSSVNRFYESDPTEVEAASAVFTSPVPYEYCSTGFIPGAYDDIYLDGEFYYYVKEGTFLWKITDADGKVAYSEEVPYADDDEEWWEYDWFGEHEMNRNGFTMTLLHDVSADDDNFSAYVSGLTYTVDLGGHTVNQQMGFGVGECDVTIVNGTVSNAGGTAISIANGAQVTLGNGLAIAQSTTGVYVEGGTEEGACSKLTVKNGAAINGTYGVLVFGSGSSNPVTEVVVEGGTITGTTYGISGNGTIEGDTDYSNTRITVSGGTVSGGEVGIYHPQAGELSVSGGTISGKMAIYARSGTIAVTGGSLNATGTGGEYNVSYAGNELQETGDALVLDAVNYPGGNPTATISGGTFVSANGDGVASYAATGQSAESGFVSGGTFSSGVPEEYCAPGYIPTAQDPDTGLYTVTEGTYVAQIVRGGEVLAKYTSFGAALEAAQSGDTVQLLANVEGVTETFELHGKNITIDGQGSYSITAGANTEPRSVVQSYGGARNMFVVLSGNVTFKGITLDGGDTHYYTFLVQAKNGTTTFDNVSLLHGGEADSSGTAGVGYGAAVQVDGATVLVTNSFYACTGTNVNDVTTGVFPFTALLYQSGGIHFDDGVTAGIGDDLLLVGMVGAVDVSTDEGRAQVSEMLGAMNVPAGYYPYTLKLGDSEMTSFTGASPLGWNGIIDYGKEIMVSANTSMGMDMNPATTPVEVGLLTDTLLPEVFTFEDANLTVNGNGNAISGTIEYTDNAGLIEDIVLGTEDNPLVLDMTGLGEGNAIHLGSDVAAASVIIKVTEEQATSLGHAIVTWDAAHETEEEAASLETGIVVEIVNAEGEPILDPETNKPKEASVIWDLELGLAYIGPCEARLTGPTHDAPIYTSLADAIARAAQTGDTVTLLMDIANVSGTYEIDKSITLDGAGYKVTAAPVATHRDVVNAWAGSTSMFKLKTGDITFRNITLDGDATHAYTFLISADNSSAKLTTENITLLHGGELCGDANGVVVEKGAGYGAGIHLNNGAALTVKDGFYADTHGAPAEAGQTIDKSDGVFPFTGILPEGGSSVLFDLVDDSNEHPTVEIGEDLLLVGMVGVIPHDEVQGILDYMKVPSRFIPYTLTLSDGSAYAFTGASPLGWNDIIDYGKEIMDVSTAIGYDGLDKDATPVEVGLLTDTALPETFTFADTNFTVNGNGHALSGTIKYTDTAGSVKNIALGSETAALVVDLSDVTNLPVTLGSGVDVANVVVNLTGEQASFGTAVFKWDAESEDGAPQHEQVVIKVAGSDSDKELVWDDEIGVAYIGPCEARLTGPGREPGYMDLTNAFDMAVGGDTVTLFWSNVTLNASLNLPAGTLLFATNKYELALGEDAALVFTNATTVFRSEMDLLDVIALAGDCANGYWLRHEADGTTNVYSVVERGEYIVTGNTEDGGVGTAVIKVSDEWIAANIGANVRTVNEIDTYLNSTNSTTNLREWEMYVLNQETPFRVTAVGKADNAVSTTLVAPASSETTGFTVAYSLDETLADGSVKTPGTQQASRDFAVPVASVTTHAFYRVRAHLTSGESTLVVDSANTIGVLKATASTAQTIVAVPWAAFGGGDVTVADLLRTDGLSADDELFVYNPSTQNFRAWTLGSGKTWEPTTVIAAGTNATPGDDASSVTVARGSGVLLKRGSVSAPLCFVGEVASGGKTALGAAQTSGSDGAQSWNLVASPSVEALDIANFPAPSSGGYDRIIVLTSGAPLNLTYKNGKWGYNKVEVKNGMAVPTRVTEGVSIPAGVGFWYLNSGAAREIEW